MSMSLADLHSHAVRLLSSLDALKHNAGDLWRFTAQDNNPLGKFVIGDPDYFECELSLSGGLEHWSSFIDDQKSPMIQLMLRQVPSLSVFTEDLKRCLLSARWSNTDLTSLACAALLEVFVRTPWAKHNRIQIGGAFQVEDEGEEIWVCNCTITPILPSDRLFKELDRMVGGAVAVSRVLSAANRRNANCTHAPDFSSVRVGDEVFWFETTQRRDVIATLWADWESGGNGLSDCPIRGDWGG